MINSTRRGFIASIGALFAAPAIVKAEWIMPVRSIIMPELIKSPDAVLLWGEPIMQYSTIGDCFYSVYEVNYTKSIYFLNERYANA